LFLIDVPASIADSAGMKQFIVRQDRRFGRIAKRTRFVRTVGVLEWPKGASFGAQTDDEFRSIHR
jgi:hypothetical protein